MKNFWVLQEKGKINNWQNSFKKMSNAFSDTPKEELISVKANIKLFESWVMGFTEPLRQCTFRGSKSKEILNLCLILDIATTYSRC